MGLFAVALVACSDENNNNDENTTRNNENEETEEVESDEEHNENEGWTKEFNQEIANNDHIKATLISVEHIIDETWDEERFEIKFEVENKRDDTIEVQAREVSADGKMVDDSLLFMSQEVSGGKKADAVLKIQSYDGDLPSMEDNIEMLLHIFSWDDFDFREDHKVIIDL